MSKLTPQYYIDLLNRAISSFIYDSERVEKIVLLLNNEHQLNKEENPNFPFVLQSAFVNFNKGDISKREQIRDLSFALDLFLRDVINHTDTETEVGLSHKQQIYLLKKLNVLDHPVISLLNGNEKAHVISKIINRGPENTKKILSNIEYLPGVGTPSPYKVTEKDVSVVNNLLIKLNLPHLL